MLKTSQLETQVKKHLEALLNLKQKNWDGDKSVACDNMQRLADYFSGNFPLAKVQPDESYQKWFLQIKEQISSLTFSDSTYAGKKIEQLRKVLLLFEFFH